MAKAHVIGNRRIPMTTKDCIFCKIAKGEISSHKIYESNLFIAFLDVSPITEGHAVLIPKRHFEKVHGLNEAECTQLGKAIFSASMILERKYGSNINLSNTSGEHASQSVAHFHFHLIPRRKGDRLWVGEQSRIVLDRSSGFERLVPSNEELDSIRDELTSHNVPIANGKYPTAPGTTI
jgi:histidine triad (HIT) family protein